MERLVTEEPKPPKPTHCIMVRCGDYRGFWTHILDGVGGDNPPPTWTSHTGKAVTYEIERI